MRIEPKAEPVERSSAVILDRLAEYGIDACSWSDPWGAGFHPSMIDDGSDILAEPYTNSPYSCRGLNPSVSKSSSSPIWSAEKHAARIRYILKTPQLMNSPIEVDCLCNAGTILAMPVIVDGWHRLHAHWFLGREGILATFGGRTDLWDYLRGVSSVAPEN